MFGERGTTRAIAVAALVMLIYGAGIITGRQSIKRTARNESSPTSDASAKSLPHFYDLTECEVKTYDSEETEVECNGEVLVSIIQLPQPWNRTIYIEGGWTNLCPRRWRGCGVTVAGAMYTTMWEGSDFDQDAIAQACADIWSTLFGSVPNTLAVSTSEMFGDMISYGPFAYNLYVEYCNDYVSTRS